jgi:Skp family chaperone for outer membrane proteins
VKLKNSIFVFIFISIFASLTHAQLGVLNSGKVQASMPVFAKIDTLIKLEQLKYQRELDSRQASIEPLVRAADSLYKLRPSDPKTQQLVQQAQKAFNEVKQFEQQANNKVLDYKNILLNPYLEKVNRAIKSTAQLKKLKQVIDVQQVPFAYVDESTDITNDVILLLKSDL